MHIHRRGVSIDWSRGTATWSVCAVDFNNGGIELTGADGGSD